MPNGTGGEVTEIAHAAGELVSNTSNVFELVALIILAVLALAGLYLWLYYRDKKHASSRGEEEVRNQMEAIKQDIKTMRTEFGGLSRELDRHIAADDKKLEEAFTRLREIEGKAKEIYTMIVDIKEFFIHKRRA